MNMVKIELGNKILFYHSEEIKKEIKNYKFESKKKIGDRFGKDVYKTVFIKNEKR